VMCFAEILVGKTDTTGTGKIALPESQRLVIHITSLPHTVISVLPIEHRQAGLLMHAFSLIQREQVTLDKSQRPGIGNNMMQTDNKKIIWMIVVFGSLANVHLQAPDM